MRKTKIKAEDYPFADLVQDETPSGFYTASWLDQDSVYIQFGITTISIPVSDFPAFVNFIDKTEFNRKAELYSDDSPRLDISKTVN